MAESGNATANVDIVGADGDFFEFLYQDKASRALTVVSWFLFSFVGTPLFAGIVSFKLHGSLSYQTLIDKWLCAAIYIKWYSFSLIMCLTLAEIQVLRYLYLCVWKNIGRLNDDLFAAFFAITNTLFGLIYGMILIVSKGYLGLEYAMCAGIDPSEKTLSPKTGGSLTTFTVGALCLTRMVFFLLIYVKTRNGIEVWQGKSLFDLERSVEALVYIGGCISVALRAYIEYKYKIGQLFLVRPVIITTSKVALHLTVIVFYPVSMYLRNKALRVHFLREIRDIGMFKKVLEVVNRMRSNVVPQ